uniref:NADH dehydrogenase subunit 6 n=1 Tax=Metacrangonyx sp. n. DJ2019 TaxID=2606684 RepID=A0A5C0Q1B6_9CRUS|nr:NADH dehydrogenase subunit 6 [Metacrangonyx sp. n. DJ2019]
MYFIFSVSSYMLIIIFFYSSHPLFMGVMVAFQSILIGLIIYMFNTISWFSYLLFMIFLSGMMVVLIYITSLASNIMMKYFFLDTASLILFILLMIAFMFTYDKLNYFCNNSIDFSNLSDLAVLSGSIYSKHSYLFTSLLIVYLLLVLILVVKNSLFSKGPLRQAS